MMIRRGILAPALRSTTRYAPVLLLWAAMFLFLWMFLASDSLERTAEAGGFLRADGSDAVAMAERYSYEWRHGMAGGWPLYVPGFFAVAISAVLWSSGRTGRSLFVQGSLALLLSLLAAKVFAPLGARWLIASFEHDTGLTLAESPMGATWSRALPGVLTVTSWVVLIVAIQAWVSRSTIWPVLAPLACYAVLWVFRPGVGDLIRAWALALARRESVAIVSTALIPVVATILWRYCVHRDADKRRDDRRLRRRGRFEPRPYTTISR